MSNSLEGNSFEIYLELEDKNSRTFSYKAIVMEFETIGNTNFLNVDE